MNKNKLLSFFALQSTFSRYGNLSRLDCSFGLTKTLFLLVALLLVPWRVSAAPGDVIFSENFDNWSSIQDGWSVEGTGFADEFYLFAAYSGQLDAVTSCDGYGTTGSVAKLTSKTFDLTSSAELTFDLIKNVSVSFEVDVLCGGIIYTVGDANFVDSESFTSVKFNLNNKNYIGKTVQLVFTYRGCGGDYLDLDNIVVTETAGGGGESGGTPTLVSIIEKFDDNPISRGWTCSPSTSNWIIASSVTYDYLKKRSDNFIYTTYYDYNGDHNVISPIFTPNLGDVTVSFSYALESYKSPTLNVYAYYDGIRHQLNTSVLKHTGGVWTDLSYQLPDEVIGKRVQIIFAFTASGNNTTIGLNDVSIIESEKPCGSASVVASGILSKSATLDITATTEQVKFAYGPASSITSDAIESGETLTVVGGSAVKSLSDLDPNTEYVVYVQPICDGETMVASYNFTTTAEPVELPFVTGFENDSENSKWVFIRENTNKLIIGSGINNGGSKALYVSNDGTNYSYSTEYSYSTGDPTSYTYAYLPVYLEAGKEYRIKYDWQSKGENGWDLGRVFLTNDKSKFGANINVRYINGVDVVGENPGVSWSTLTKIVTVSSTGLYYFVIGWYNDGSGGTNPPLAIDNLTISEKPCGDASITVGAVDETTATLDIVSDTENVEFAYGEKGKSVVDLIPESSAKGSKILSGLTAGTEYVAYVRPVCGGYAEWVQVEFKTAPPVIATFPYSTGFEASDNNGYWAIDGKGTNQLMIGDGTNHGGSHALYISNNGNYGVQDYAASTTLAYIKVNLTAGKYYTVKYDWIGKGDNVSCARMYLTQNESEIAPSYSILANTPSNPIYKYEDERNADKMLYNSSWKTYTKENFQVAETGIYYLVYAWSYDGQYYTNSPYHAIDNFSITESDCFGVTVELSEATSNSAAVSISTLAASAELIWGPIGAENAEACPAENKQTISNYSTPVTISNLNSGTEYSAFVRSVCGSNYGDWVRIDFATDFPPASVPYPATGDDAFETDAAGWKSAHINGPDRLVFGSDANAQNGAGSTTALYVSPDGATCAITNACGGNDDGVTTMVYRQVQLESGKSYVASYNWRNPRDNGKLYVILLTNSSYPLSYYRNSTNQWSSLFYNVHADQTMLSSADYLMESSNWKSENFPFTVASSGEYTILIAWESYASYNWDDSSAPYLSQYVAVDNFKITEVACPNASMTLNGLFDTEVSFNITTPGTTAQLVYGPKGKSADECLALNQMNVTEFGSSTVVTGLTAATEYVAYVRTVCDGGKTSDWSEGVNFKTVAAATGIPYDNKGFDNATENAAWTLVGDNTNKFVFGTGADGGKGTTLYISDNGVDYQYTDNSISSKSEVYAIRLINLEAGKKYKFGFEWKCVGSNQADGEGFARVYITKDYNLTTSTTGNYASICYGDMNSQPRWKQEVRGEVEVEETGKYYLVVAWRNGGNNQKEGVPVAINNLTVSTSVPAVPDYISDFENPAENLAWTIVGEGDNQLAITEFEGRQALYITNGGENKFSFTSASTSVAYREIDLVAGEMYKVEFDWTGSNVNLYTYDAFAYPAVYLTQNIDELQAEYNHRLNAPESPINDIEMTDQYNGWSNYKKEGITVDANGTYYLVIAWQNSTPNGYGTSAPYFGLDNLKVMRMDCYDVTINENSLTVTDKTATFYVETSVTSVEVRWGAKGQTFADCQSTATIINDIANGITITGLAADTEYVVYVRSSCGDGKFGIETSIEFKTVSTPAEMPYSYDFDNNNDNIVNWNFGGAFELTTTDKNNSLTVSASALETAGSYTAYRTINLVAGTYVVEYDWKAGGNEMSNNGSITISEYLDGGMGYGSSLYGKTDWEHHKQIDFIVHEDGMYYFIVRWNNYDTQNATSPIVVDNISIRPVDCEHVAVSTTTIEESSVKLYLGTVKNVDLRWDVKGTAVDLCKSSLDNVVVTGNSYTIEGLESKTEYVVYVRSVCGGDKYGEWNSVEFKTAIIPATVPYSYDFENGSDDDNWILTPRTEWAKNGFVIGTDVDAQNTGSSKSLYTTNNGTDYGYVKGGYTQNFAYRSIRLSADMTYTVSFDWRNEGLNSGDDKDYLRVFLIDSKDGNWNIPFTGCNEDNAISQSTTNVICVDGGNAMLGQANWTSFVSDKITVPATGTYSLVFAWRNSNAGAVTTPAAIDNIVVDEAVCGEAFVEAVPGYYSAELNITSDTENVLLAYGPAGTAVEDLVPETIAAGSTTIDYLEQQTQYVVYVKPVCSGKTEWKSTEFTTLNADFVTLYRFDFENSAQDAQWQFLHSGDNNLRIGGSTYKNDGGMRSLYVSYGSFYQYYSYSSSKTFAYVEMQLEKGVTYAISYDWMSEGDNHYWDAGRVYLTQSMSDISTSLTINGSGIYYAPKKAIFLNDGYYSDGHYFMSSQSDWTTYTNNAVTVPATGTYYFVVAWENGGNGKGAPLAVDNILVQGPVSSCGYASAALVERNATSATLNITSTTGEVEFAYGVAGTAVEELVPETIAAGEKVLTGLIKATGYVAYMRPVCSGRREWTPFEFATAYDPVSVYPYVQDFENAVENQAWTIVGEGDNQLATATFGDRTALYITNNGENRYDKAMASTSVAYRELNLKAGQLYKVEYEWTGAGYNYWSEGDANSSVAYPAVYLTQNPAELAATYNHREDAPTNPINSDVMVYKYSWEDYRKEGITVDATGTYYLAVAWQNNAGNYGDNTPYFGLDNLTVSEIDCYDVEIPESEWERDLSVTATTASFNVKTSASTVEVRYGAPGSSFEACATMATVSVVEGRVTIEGLTANTAYIAYVRSSCGGGKYGTPLSIEFTTETTPATVPYDYDFDNGNDEVANWTLDGKFVVDQTVAVTGKGLHVSNAALATAGEFTAYRTINLTAGTYVVEYDWKAEGKEWENTGSISIAKNLGSGMGYYGSPLSENDLFGQSDWAHFRKIDVNVEEDGMYYFIVRWNNGDAATQNAPLAVDNIVIRKAACEHVDIYINDIQTISVRLGFSTDKSVDLRWGEKGTAVESCAGSLDNVALTDNSYTITGLVDATEYVVYVRTVCDADNKGEWNSVEFKTKVIPATVPYSYDFEDGSDDRNWTLTTPTKDYPNSFVIGSDADAQNGSSAKSLYVTSNGSDYGYVKGNYSQAFAYRTFALEAGTNYTVFFDWKNEGVETGSYDSDYLRVFLVDETTSNNWHSSYADCDMSYNSDNVICVDGGTAMLGQSEWISFRSEEITVPTTGTYSLVFAWRNDYNGTATTPAAIDNIEVMGPPCGTASASLVSCTYSTAQLDITTTVGSTVELAYGQAGAHVSELTPEVVNAGELELSGLASATEYVVYVRPVCEGSRIWYSMEFETPIKPAEAPYNYDFDNANDAVGSWVMDPEFAVGSAAGGSGDALYVSNGGSAYSSTGIWGTKKAYRSFNLTAGTYVVEFDWKAVGDASNNYGNVGIYQTLGEYFNGVPDSEYGGFIASSLYDQSEWQHYKNDKVEINEDGICYLLVKWDNYKPESTTAPLAVDNITIRKCVDLTWDQDLSNLSTANRGVVMTCESNINGTEGIVYESSDESIATINGNKISVVGIGEVTITASHPGNNEYAKASISQTIYTQQGEVMMIDPSGSWSDPTNWTASNGYVSTEALTAEIFADMIVRIDREYTLNDNSSLKGIIIEADGKLIIAPTTVLKVESIVNDNADNLVLQANENGSATLRFLGDAPKATVELYSKAHSDNKNGNYSNPHWQYLGVSVDAQAKSEFGNGLLYEWVEATNATSCWNNVKDSLYSWRGYCFTHFEATKYVTSGTLINSDHTYTLTYTAGANNPDVGNNLMTNSYSAPIDLSKLTIDDFVNAEATVYIYNTGSYGQWQQNESTGSFEGTNAGQFLTMPIKVAPTMDYTVIPQMQAFFVVATAPNASFTVDYENDVYGSTEANKPMRAPRRDAMLNMLEINVSNNQFADNVYLFEHESCSEEFDNGYDGTKWAGGSNVPMIYATTPTAYNAVNTEDSISGQVVGFRGVVGENALYRMTFNTSKLSGYETLYLYDSIADIYHDILSGAAYDFYADGNHDERRFHIVGSAATEDDNNTGSGDITTDIQVIGDRICFAETNGTLRIVDLSGKTLYSVEVKDNMNEIPMPDLVEGVYIISINAQTTKVIVKR